MDIAKLTSLVAEAESSLSSLWSEQRSNCSLVQGQHFNRKDSRFLERLRSNEDLSKTQKIRLTKNHIGKISRSYRNNLLTFAPGVGIYPANENELADQKAANLHRAVWSDIQRRHNFRQKIREAAQDFVDIGEVAWKVFWDDRKGTVLGYEQIADEMGQPLFNPDGSPALDDTRPIMSGDLVFERIFGPNLITDCHAKSWEDMRFAGLRKMVQTDKLKSQFPELQNTTGETDDTFKMFDGATGTYADGKGMTLVRELYFRPCDEYPNGYFFIFTRSEILAEGELPKRLFPIVYAGFEEIPTSPRCYSIIRTLRPYQAEINRAASMIAETQCSGLGQDKIIIQNGAGAVSPAGTAHGIRAIKVSGGALQVLPGRAGDQFMPYVEATVAEMYNVANVLEDLEEKMEAQTDPYASLFKSIRQKKRFILYAEKFEDFQISVCDIALRLAKAYYPNEMLVPAIGKREWLNIAEFRAADDLGFQIKLAGEGQDASSQIGKILAINHFLQYAGSSLTREDLGKIARSMPYLGAEWDDLSLDYDNATNTILALDRGQNPPIYPSENHEYMLARLTARQKQADFPSLPPQIQQAYAARMSQHQAIMTQQKQDAAAAQAGWIPSGGGYIGVDVWIPKGGDPNKMIRARVPQEAINWLLDRLEKQGNKQAQLAQMPLEQQSALAQQGFGQELGIPPIEQMGGMPSAMPNQAMPFN